MSIEALRDALLWCALINCGVLLVWFAAICFAREGIYRLHPRWFRLSIGQFDSIHYKAMAAYKIGVLLLNLVPYFALLIVAP